MENILTKAQPNTTFILMRKHSAPGVIKQPAVCAHRRLLKVKALGVTRIGATATAAIIEDAKKDLAHPTMQKFY